MSTSSPASATPTAYPHAIASSIRLGRNQIVQVFGITMVALVGLSVLPWPYVIAWAGAIVATVGAEDLLLQRIATGRASRAIARFGAPALRILATFIYALAALVLIAKGGAGQRLFAFALMSASMVHVLMRYYRSPPVALGTAGRLAGHIFIHNGDDSGFVAEPD